MTSTRFDWEPILRFWFGPDPADPAAVREKQPLWFTASDATDQEIRRLFYQPWRSAARGELDGWRDGPRGGLALVILLDQFSRNLGRGSAEAFAHDVRALAIANALIESGRDRTLTPAERSFLYLPFEHSEDIEVQRRGLEHFEALVAEGGPDWAWLTEDALHWARMHLEIIERFGRFPHRNQVLGRQPTEAEERYLAEGGLHFGQ
jgi:uncharacterized protein (DUF924 family)